jgi:predicted AAA+ superfamily ATPase
MNQSEIEYKELLDEVFANSGLRDRGLFDDVLQCIASKAGQTVTASVISTAFKNVLMASVSHNTIKKYLAALQQSGIVVRVSRHYLNGTKLPVKGGDHCYIRDLELFEYVCGNNIFFDVFKANANKVYDLAFERTRFFNEALSRGYHIEGGRVEYSIRSKKVGSKRVGQNIDFILEKGEKEQYFTFMSDAQRQALETQSDGAEDFLRAIRSVKDDRDCYVVNIHSPQPVAKQLSIVIVDNPAAIQMLNE